jgi:hypothetical protein
MSEKREYPRLNCGFEVTLISNGHFFRDKLVDISEGGAQLELSLPFALARDVLIRARIGEHIILALGDIKWSKVKEEARRIGISFIYLHPSIRSRIRSMAIC